MEKEFVPYKEALALKELGFDDFCFDSYDPKGLMGQQTNNSAEWIKHNSKCCSAPLWQQAFRWLKDKHELAWEQQFTDSQLYVYVGEIAYPEPCFEHFKVFEVEYGKYDEITNIAKHEVLKKLIEIVTTK